MAQTKKASSGSSASARRGSGARSAGSGASRSAGGSSRSAATSQRDAARNAATNGAEGGAGGFSAVTDAGRSVVRNAAFPIATAMAGAAAAMALNQRQSRPKKVLGIPIPGTGKNGVDGLAKNVAEASKQLARLADEVRTSRKKAEEIGRALS